jgi:hypothetical protein
MAAPAEDDAGKFFHRIATCLRRARALACAAPDRESSSQDASCGRQTSRRSESVGTDSRDLRLAEVVNTPAEAFAAKIFFMRVAVPC